MGSGAVWIYSDTANAIVEYERCIKACHFISLNVAMSCCTIFKMHDVHSVCFVNYWFEIINYAMHYIHVLQMYCMWIKDGVHFKFNSGQFSGLPTELPTISILESSGLPTELPNELPTELPTISVNGSSWQPSLHGKIPMGSPWAAHFTAHWAAHFFIFWRSGLPTELPTELPTVSIFGSSGQPNLHGKLPWAAHGQPTPLPTWSPWAAKWAAPLFFPYGSTEKDTVSVVIFAGGKFRENVGKTFHVGLIFTILLLFLS